jgi:hypothetical protein
MTYNQELTAQVEKILKEMDPPDLDKQEMFGSIAFTVQGNASVGVYKDKLLVLIRSDKNDTILKNPHVIEFDVTRSFMKDWILLDGPGFKTEDELRKWIKMGVDSGLILPPK